MRVVGRGSQIIGLKHRIHATVVGKPVCLPVADMGRLVGIFRLKPFHFGKAEGFGPAIGLDFNEVSRNAFADQVILYDLSAPLREQHVVTAWATAVSVRFEQ